MSIAERKEWVFQKYSGHPFFRFVAPAKAKEISDIMFDKAFDECKCRDDKEDCWDMICRDYECRLNVAREVITALG